MSALSDRIYAKVAPVARQDASFGYPLRKMIEAWCQPIDELASLVASETDDLDPGWAKLLDPTKAPDSSLDWLSQLIGGRLIANEPAASKRAKIASAVGLTRGSPSAIVAAAQPTLTGHKYVGILERTSSAWTVTVITRTAETPDAAATLRAIMSQKPAGIVLTHVVSDDPIWDEATLTWNAVGAAETWNTIALGDV